MKSRKYKNFDEALYNIGREVLYKPYDMIDYTASHTAFIEDLILKENYEIKHDGTQCKIENDFQIGDG